MAIAGGATVAYRCRVIDDTLIDTRTTYPVGMCEKLESALTKLQSGDVVIVAGADKHALNERLIAMGVNVGSQ